MGKNKQVVLFLCRYQSVYGGNFVPSLLALEEEVNRRGGTCVYVFPTGAAQREWVENLKQMGKTVEFFDFSVSRFEQIKQLGALIKKYEVTVVHAHFVALLLLELFAFLHRQVRVIVHIHSDFSQGKKSFRAKVKNYLLYNVLARRVRFISVSKAFVSFNPARIKWVPNALAVKRMPCKPMSGAEIRQQYGVGENEILCEIFGWSPQVKGVDVAVESIKRLNEQEKKYKLALICGREMTPHKMPQWVAAHTSCSGQEDFLLYLPPVEDVFGYHKAADVLLSASRSEGFPYSILEMLSLGKPCAVSDIAGVEWSKKYPLVCPFPSENVTACVAAIKTACAAGTPENSTETARRIKADYNIDSWAKRVADEYQC